MVPIFFTLLINEKGTCTMEEKKTLNCEKLANVSGGETTDRKTSFRDIKCPLCQHKMYVTKVVKGSNGESIRTLHCDGCGYEYVQ